MSKKTELLIDAVKNYPILYSKVSSVNNEDKNQAWIHITKALNEENVQNVKSKWRNLRDSYLKAIRNKKDLEEINQLHRYKPYKHEEKMHFLHRHILQEINQRKRKCVKMVDTEEIKQDKNSYVYAVEPEYLIETEEEDHESQSNGEEESAVNEEILLEENDADDDSSMLQMESEGNYVEDNILQEHLMVQEQNHHHKSKDEVEIEAWLSSIRESMKNLSKINRAKAKRDINNILSKYEIEEATELTPSTS